MLSAEEARKLSTKRIKSIQKHEAAMREKEIEKEKKSIEQLIYQIADNGGIRYYDLYISFPENCNWLKKLGYRLYKIKDFHYLVEW